MLPGKQHHHAGTLGKWEKGCATWWEEQREMGKSGQKGMLRVSPGAQALGSIWPHPGRLIHQCGQESLRTTPPWARKASLVSSSCLPSLLYSFRPAKPEAHRTWPRKEVRDGFVKLIISKPRNHLWQHSKCLSLRTLRCCKRSPFNRNWIFRENTNTLFEDGDSLIPKNTQIHKCSPWPMVSLLQGEAK